MCWNCGNTGCSTTLDVIVTQRLICADSFNPVTACQVRNVLPGKESSVQSLPNNSVPHSPRRPTPSHPTHPTPTQPKMPHPPTQSKGIPGSFTSVTVALCDVCLQLCPHASHIILPDGAILSLPPPSSHPPSRGSQGRILVAGQRSTDTTTSPAHRHQVRYCVHPPAS